MTPVSDDHLIYILCLQLQIDKRIAKANKRVELNILQHYLKNLYTLYFNFCLIIFILIYCKATYQTIGSSTVSFTSLWWLSSMWIGFVICISKINTAINSWWSQLSRVWCPFYSKYIILMTSGRLYSHSVFKNFIAVLKDSLWVSLYRDVDSPTMRRPCKHNFKTASSNSIDWAYVDIQNEK